MWTTILRILGAKKLQKYSACMKSISSSWLYVANIFWASIMSWFKRTQQSIQNNPAWAARRPLFRCQSLRFVQPFRVCESSEYKEPGLVNWRKSERGLDCFEIANKAAPNINGTKFNSLEKMAHRIIIINPWYMICTQKRVETNPRQISESQNVKKGALWSSDLWL